MDGEMQLPVCPGVMRVMRNANACYGSKQTTREAREGKFYNDCINRYLVKESHVATRWKNSQLFFEVRFQYTLI
jgi:hypothetical protein